MMFLKVPYAEKDEAKALGARWNAARKCWYVPDGKDNAPFARWASLDAGPGALPAAPSSRDTYSAKPVIGANYLELAHACNPFEACAVCAPLLRERGWLDAQQALRTLLATL